MPTTQPPQPAEFIDHDAEEFLRTWTLLEYLACHVRVDTTSAADMVMAATFAYDAYTEHGLHRPSPTAELHFPHPDTAPPTALLRTLEDLLAAQLGVATEENLSDSLRVRRALDHVRRALAGVDT